MTRMTRELPIALVLSLVAGVGLAQADSKGTLIALRMPSHETRVRTTPLTQHPRELQARVTAELRDLTTSEKLARKYPPKKFDLWGLKFQYERYPVGPVETVVRVAARGDAL